MFLITMQKYTIPNTILLFLFQTYVVCVAVTIAACGTVTIVVSGTVTIFSLSHCSSSSVSEKLSSSLLWLRMSTPRSIESMERLFLCIVLTAPGFLGNDALDG